MKTLDLQKIIREEIKKALKEADTDSIADQLNKFLYIYIK